MNEELIKALKDELEAFKASMPEYASVEDVQKMAETIEAKLQDSKLTKELETLRETVKTHSETMVKMNAQKIADSGKSVYDYCKEHVDKFADVVSGKSRNFTMHISKADVLRASVVDSTQAMRLPDVGQVARQNTVLAPLFRQGRVGANSNGVIRYVDQTIVGGAGTGGAGTVAEGALKGESVATWVEKMLNLEKIADSIPVSMEAMKDVDFMAGELQRLLEVNISIKEDQQLWNGDGNTPNLQGVYTAADVYVAPAAHLVDANIYDLIIKMQESIVNMAGKKYRPDYAVMNISDINLMRLKKDANHNYILPPFVDANGSAVAGIKIIQSDSVAPNTMLVGDFNYGTLYTLDDLTVQVGYVGDQFTHNMMTLLAEKREALLVRDVDTSAFSACNDIQAALTALEA